MVKAVKYKLKKNWQRRSKFCTNYIKRYDMEVEKVIWEGELFVSFM